jgi:HEAT repeat protein
MASRLSSLLVSDGVVSVKRMEHAFQRQVIYGGSLDTILLEMNIVPEERLVQYLSKATGLPPATREETEAVDPATVARCPMDVARIYRIVPLCFAEGALRLLVQEPVEMAVLEELANELEVPVQPLVVPEYRFHLVFTRVYGGTPDARYETLARRAEEIAPSQPVGKARTIIVDTSSSASLSGPVPRPNPPAPITPASPHATPGARHQPAEEPAQFPEHGEGRRAGQLEPPPRRPERRTMEMATAALTRRSESDRVREGHAPTEPGIGAPAPLPAQPGSGPVTAPPEAAARTGTLPAREVLGRQDTAPLGYIAVTTSTAPTSPGKRSARLGPAAQAVMNLPPELPTAPLAPEAAMEALPHADDRDLIFNLLLRAMRDRVHYAALFTVQDGAAIGRIAIDGDEIDRADVARILIPLDQASPFRTVVRSVAPYFGALATGTPTIDIMLAALGGMPRSGLLLPVVLRGRVVAIALGHSGDQQLEPSALAALLPVASRAAEAISRLIVKTKAQRRVEQTDASADHRPAASARAITAEPTTQEMPHPPIDSVLSAVQSDDPAVARAARNAALGRPAEAVAALAAYFPGELRIERYELEGRAIPAAEHGPLLELTVAMGAAAGDLLIAKMRDIDRDTRYYAALCAAESRPRAAVDSLVERLFDSDYGVRSIAIDALKGYPQAVLEQGLQPAREALLSSQPARVQAAANALAKIGDADAVPVLIDVLDQGTDAAEHARRALIKLAKQDCGTSASQWRTWWNEHRDRHRMEWLIEALGQKDENLASEAVEELRQATGEYFGFHHDLPQQERDQAQQRWIDWWEQSGRQRFAAGQTS